MIKSTMPVFVVIGVFLILWILVLAERNELNKNKDAKISTDDSTIIINSTGGGGNISIKIDSSDNNIIQVQQ